MVPIAPLAFDLLEFLIRNRERVLTRDDLIASSWNGRIVSESALGTCVNAPGRNSGLSVRCRARACASWVPCAKCKSRKHWLRPTPQQSNQGPYCLFLTVPRSPSCHSPTQPAIPTTP